MHSKRRALITVVTVALVACQTAPPESAPSATDLGVMGASASASPTTPSGSASPTPIPDADVVTAGLFAEVVTTDLVRRSAPRVADDSVIMGEFNPPTQLYVEGGPVLSDGYRWFLVNDMETWTRGWVAEADKDGEVWLRPGGREAGEWTVAGSIGVSGTANVRGATAGVDGTIYVFGGLSGGFGEPVSSAAWAFDPDELAWRELSPMPAPRDAAQVVLARDGRLYVIGGAAGGEAVSTVAVYDPASDSWDTAPPAPVPVAWGSAVVSTPDGRILLFRHSEAWSYNPQNGQGERIGQYDGVPNDAVVTAAGEMYVLPESGGVLGSAGGPRRFDPIAGTLGEPTDSRIDRTHATGAVLPDGRILVVGGGTAGGPCCIVDLFDPADPVIEAPLEPLPPLPAEAFDVTDGTWSTLAPLPAGLGYVGAVVSDGRVFAVAWQEDRLLILELIGR